MTPMAATNAIQIPMPRPSAGSTASGIEMMRIRTKISGERPEREHDQALRDRRGQLEARFTERDEREHGEPDEEHELAEDAGVPADHRELHADAGSGVPAHERRERKHETRDPRDALAGSPQAAGGRPGIAGRVRGAGPRRTGRYLDLEEVWCFHVAKYGDHAGRKLSEPVR